MDLFSKSVVFHSFLPFFLTLPLCPLEMCSGTLSSMHTKECKRLCPSLPQPLSAGFAFCSTSGLFQAFSSRHAWKKHRDTTLSNRAAQFIHPKPPSLQPCCWRGSAGSHGPGDRAERPRKDRSSRRHRQPLHAHGAQLPKQVLIPPARPPDGFF